MAMARTFEADEVITVQYPFIRDEYRCDTDVESGRDIFAPTWKPGTRFEAKQDRDGEMLPGSWEIDGLGAMVLTVVSVHKPGRFPTRVFFTRQWINPDGKTFGKGGCRVVTLEKFRRLASGYQHEFSREYQQATA